MRWWERTRVPACLALSNKKWLKKKEWVKGKDGTHVGRRLINWHMCQYEWHISVLRFETCEMWSLFSFLYFVFFVIVMLLLFNSVSLQTDELGYVDYCWWTIARCLDPYPCWCNFFVLFYFLPCLIWWLPFFFQKKKKNRFNTHIIIC